MSLRCRFVIVRTLLEGLVLERMDDWEPQADCVGLVGYYAVLVEAARVLGPVQSYLDVGQEELPGLEGLCKMGSIEDLVVVISHHCPDSQF